MNHAHSSFTVIAKLTTDGELIVQWNRNRNENSLRVWIYRRSRDTAWCTCTCPFDNLSVRPSVKQSVRKSGKQTFSWLVLLSVRLLLLYVRLSVRLCWRPAWFLKVKTAGKYDLVSQYSIRYLSSRWPCKHFHCHALLNSNYLAGGTNYVTVDTHAC